MPRAVPSGSRGLRIAGGVILAGFALIASMHLLTDPSDSPVVIMGTSVPPLPTLDPGRVQLGAQLYAAVCAGCHGVRLEGASNWRQRALDGSLPPPPHDATGHTWHHADILLLDIIANSRDAEYNSRMPAFGERMTTDEMLAVLEYIRSHWGGEEREFQWWITAREDRASRPNGGTCDGH